MHVKTHTNLGEVQWSQITPGHTELDEEKRISEEIAKIHSLYNSGLPFYTKKRLQDIDQQLERLARISEANRRGEKVSVEGLDGNRVDFTIETGRTLPCRPVEQGDKNTEFEMIIRDPCILYSSFQMMTSRDWKFVPQLSYCNIQIRHYMMERSSTTKECVSSVQPTSSSKKLVSNVPIPPLNAIEEAFLAIRNTWEASEACQQLRSILTSVDISCSKIVGFALGTMAYSAQDRSCRRSAFQHALALTLQDILSKKSEERSREKGPLQTDPLNCYTQDPMYSSVDRSVIEGHGIVVLNDPKGFLEVDESSAIISCAADIPVKQIVSDLAWPALMIWDRVEDEEPKYMMSDPDSPRLRKGIRKLYDSYEFPGDYDSFGDLVIYVRRATANARNTQDRPLE